MPQKRNGSGGMQNYVPAGNGDASGEYGDNATGSNKHFQSFKKPDENNIGTQITGQPNEINAKAKYNGKGKEKLSKTLSSRLSGKNGKITPNGKKLLEQISNADDELSGVISDMYDNNPQLKLKVGANLNSRYRETTFYSFYSGRWKEYEVALGNESFNETNNYAKGGVFFHESGHALDNSYIDETNHKSCWSFYYKSKEFNKTLSEMVLEELKPYQDKEKYNELKTIANNYGNEEWLKYEKGYNDLKEKAKYYNQTIMSDPQVVEYSKQISQLGDELVKLKKQLREQIDDDYSVEKTKPITDKITEKRNELIEVSRKTSDYQNELYEKKFPQLKEERKRLDELIDLKYKLRDEAESKKQIAWGELSDLVESVTGQSLTGMGHLARDGNYWDAKGYNRGQEAFAEIMSAKATNPESLKNMQKYIPKSLKIFDEIMGEIKK